MKPHAIEAPSPNRPGPSPPIAHSSASPPPSPLPPPPSPGAPPPPALPRHFCKYDLSRFADGAGGGSAERSRGAAFLSRVALDLATLALRAIEDTPGGRAGN